MFQLSPASKARFALGLAVATTASAAFLAATSPLMAETIKLQATLIGAEEVPPTTSKGTGTLNATFDTDTRKLTWSVSYSGLTGTPIAAHFHGPAPVGKNAPIEVPATDVDQNPITGSATLTESQAKDLLDGNVYFNIHTEANKPGEIRGQVEKVPN